VVVAAFAAVPVGLLVAGLLAARRGGWRDPLLEVAIVLGTAPWLWMILSPAGTGRSVNLVPFADLADVLAAAPAVVVEQVGGNLLVLAALGFALPLRWRWFARPVRVAAAAGAVAVSVEVLQYLLAIGRHSSIDDVLVNVAGAVLAASCSRRWWAHRADRRPA
jgi:glycopeptide antibiotics resistance protein